MLQYQPTFLGIPVLTDTHEVHQIEAPVAATLDSLPYTFAVTKYQPTISASPTHLLKYQPKVVAIPILTDTHEVFQIEAPVTSTLHAHPGTLAATQGMNPALR